MYHNGSNAYVHIPMEVWNKPDANAEKCVFVGYSKEKKGYTCYNPITKNIQADGR